MNPVNRGVHFQPPVNQAPAQQQHVDPRVQQAANIPLAAHGAAPVRVAVGQRETRVNMGYAPHGQPPTAPALQGRVAAAHPQPGKARVPVGHGHT